MIRIRILNIQRIMVMINKMAKKKIRIAKKMMRIIIMINQEFEGYYLRLNKICTVKYKTN